MSFQNPLFIPGYSMFIIKKAIFVYDLETIGVTFRKGGLKSLNCLHHNICIPESFNTNIFTTK